MPPSDTPAGGPAPAAPPPEPAALPAGLAEAIAGLGLARDRPLLVCDADEVLFHFMARLELYLDGEGLTFDWSSYGLLGNIRGRDGVAIGAEALGHHLGRFFELHTEAIEPVEGAAESLGALARAGLQVVVLSNVPDRQRTARERALARAGMPYPLVANAGLKGPAVRALAGLVDAPVAFVDDIPRQHAAVRRDAPAVHRIHFVANPRLAALVGPAPDADRRVATWDELRAAIAAHAGLAA